MSASRMSGTSPGGYSDGCVAEDVRGARCDVSCASAELAASSGATASRLEQSASVSAEAHAEAQANLVPYSLSESESSMADDELVMHDHLSAEPVGVCSRAVPRLVHMLQPSPKGWTSLRAICSLAVGWTIDAGDM